MRSCVLGRQYEVPQPPKNVLPKLRPPGPVGQLVQTKVPLDKDCFICNIEKINTCLNGDGDTGHHLHEIFKGHKIHLTTKVKGAVDGFTGFHLRAENEGGGSFSVLVLRPKRRPKSIGGSKRVAPAVLLFPTNGNQESNPYKIAWASLQGHNWKTIEIVNEQNLPRLLDDVPELQALSVLPFATVSYIGQLHVWDNRQKMGLKGCKLGSLMPYARVDKHNDFDLKGFVLGVLNSIEALAMKQWIHSDIKKYNLDDSGFLMDCGGMKPVGDNQAQHDDFGTYCSFMQVLAEYGKKGAKFKLSQDSFGAALAIMDAYNTNKLNLSSYQFVGQYNAEGDCLLEKKAFEVKKSLVDNHVQHFGRFISEMSLFDSESVNAAFKALLFDMLGIKVIQESLDDPSFELADESGKNLFGTELVNRISAFKKILKEAP